MVRLLFTPTGEMADRLATTTKEVARSARSAALGLQRLCDGELRGMFDGPTSSDLDVDSPAVVLDLSAVYHSAALGILMTCAAAWQRAVIADRHAAADRAGHAGAEGHQRRRRGVEGHRRPRHRRVAAGRLQALARVRGAEPDRPAPTLRPVGAGDSGTRERALAEGLLHDAQTRVVYSQYEDELPRTRELLGLTSTEARIVGELDPGIALWKVGRRSFLVQHRLSPLEVELVDTDARMLDAGGGRRAAERVGRGPVEVHLVGRSARSTLAGLATWSLGIVAGVAFGDGAPDGRPRQPSWRSLPGSPSTSTTHARPGRGGAVDAAGTVRASQERRRSWSPSLPGSLSRPFGLRDDRRRARSGAQLGRRPRPPRASRARANGGRLVLGRHRGTLLAAEARQSVIVVAPTQTGKTTGLAVPAILEWDGPVLATSVKTDLVRDTIARRRAGGRRAVFDPTAVTGSPGHSGRLWPVATTGRGRARRPSDSCSVAQARARDERRRLLDGAAARFLAPLLFAAAREDAHDGRRRALGRRRRSRDAARDPRGAPFDDDP